MARGFQGGDCSLTNYIDNSNIIDIAVTENTVTISDTGQPGPRGNSVLHGYGAPADTLGVEGDFYLDIEIVSGRPKYHLYGPRTYDQGWPIVTNGLKYVDLFTLPESFYVYTGNENVASGEWVIDHNLGFHPSVTVVTDTGDVVEGEIRYNSLNRVTIYFNGSFAGKAYLS